MSSHQCPQNVPLQIVAVNRAHLTRHPHFACHMRPVNTIVIEMRCSVRSLESQRSLRMHRRVLELRLEKGIREGPSLSHILAAPLCARLLLITVKLYFIQLCIDSVISNIIGKFKPVIQ